MERDERRLGDLGRRTVEMYALAHIFGELEAAYCEAESIKRQDALIREEEEAGQAEGARTAARMAADKEKKARKKVGVSAACSLPEVQRYTAVHHRDGAAPLVDHELMAVCTCMVLHMPSTGFSFS